MTRMDGGHRCNNTLTHRVWFLNKHILVGNGHTANSNISVLVANNISNYVPEAQNLPDDSEKTNTLHMMSESIILQLTSLPMQRCCPTPFSHLWWRLILQALQRRPCFAVFPAKNTTCLAVVPDSHTQETGSDLWSQERDSLTWCF